MKESDPFKKRANRKFFFWLVLIGLVYAVPRLLEDQGILDLGLGGTEVRERADNDASRTSLSAQEEAIARAIRNGATNDLHNLASIALQYRMRPASLAGGQGSYAGFKIPGMMKANENATYDVQVLSSDRIRFVAVSAKNRHDMIVVEADRLGNLGGWTFTGAFRHLK